MSVPMSGGYYRPQINFDWISQAWSLFKSQTGAWVGAILLFLLVALALDVPLAFVTGYIQPLIATFRTVLNHEQPPQPDNPFAGFGHGLLFGIIASVIQNTLVGGLYRMAIRQGRGEMIKATDVFSAFDVILPLVGLGIITQLLVTIGSYLCILPGLVVAGLFMFAPLLVVDRRLGPIQAITESISLLKSQWLMATLFYFVVALIGGLGAAVCLVGMAVTYPVLVLSVALAYLTFTQPGQPMTPPYGAPQQGVWPPPPSA